MSRLKLFLPLIIFVILAVLFWDVLTQQDYDPQDLPSALIDQPLPEFSLQKLDDESTIVRADIIGDVFLLNVWATWCITCRIEHAYLNTLAKQGVKIIGLDYKDDREKARAWVKELGNPYQLILSDPEGTLGLDLGVYGAPETYLVDKTGIIRYKHVGDINVKVWQKTLEKRYRELQQK